MFGFASLTIVALASSALAAPFEPRAIDERSLPNVISAATARSYLSSLTVAAESNSPAYDRDLFPTWITSEGKCNTREYILRRDATTVTEGSDCYPTSGTWTSAYDGVKTTLPSDLDIDHIVPLKEAWVSGARTWTTAQRQGLANDVTRPQLIAVTDNLNQSKGDKDIAEWVPPLKSYVCTYVRAWVQVKHYYDLTVDSAEKTAISKYLADC
ncbi:hypothetical protein BD626DRAFT_581525 [Schizophyllum amplum]|uniref:GmrSD restriction endonucleases C-terminal domain-containing protein n=1 Tax=Schizophyllum amplum TaxID=97359 RepID=A0A550CP97_9AGAR|nr:hypothetical protein BD626DRAFT_581525 [Auriculariopsis ampla]